MATYSKQDFDAQHYHDARPLYPDSYYETLIGFHKEKAGNTTNLAMDIGTGSGFVALKLADYFDRVIGTDLSKTMIEASRQNAISAKKDSVDFLVAPAEITPKSVKEGSIDLITAAEACHWMDMDRVFEEAYRVLKPNGTLSWWFYLDPVFVGFPEATKLNLEFSYASSVEKYGDDYEKFLGPFFENPGHEKYREGLRDVFPPEKYFYDTVQKYYHPEQNERDYTTLFIEKQITLRTYKNYGTSWSGYHSWKKAFPEKPDTVDEFISKLQKIIDVDLDTPINVIFPTIYTLTRRR